ncbi:MAG: glycosyltransferase [Mycobacteriales bacterium]
MAWFAKAVWPLLQPGSPPLRVVGRGGGAALGRLARHPALRVVGEVADVAPYLGEAGGVLVPLQRGSGSRLKVLEALAFGRPVVSTTLGASGLPIRSGVDALLADTPRSFATAIAALDTDRTLAARLATSGRRLAERFAWPQVRARFSELLDEL